MKRVFVFVLALVILASPVALSSCNDTKPLPSTSDELKSALEQRFNDAQTEFEKLTDELSKEKFEEEFYEEIAELCGKIVKAFPDKEVAVSALLWSDPYLEGDKFDKLYAKLSDKNKENPQIVSIKNNRAVMMQTSEGKMFVDFEVNGVKFSDYIGKGKYVLVDFWASWCGPCRGEIPNIKAVYEKYAGEKFDVLSVAVWDDPKKTAEAAEEEGIKWNQIVDAQKIPTDLYGIQGIPQIMLFGPDGTILRRDLRGAEIEKAVVKALGK